MFPQKLKTKVAAAVIAVTLGSAGAAAASKIPNRLEKQMSRAPVHIEMKRTQPSGAVTNDRDDEADESDDTTTTAASTSSTSTSTTSTTQSPTSTTEADDADQKATPVGPDANGPAKKGLCNAYLGSLAKGHPKNTDAVAFKNLVNAAALAGETVQVFCATDTSTSTTTQSPTTTDVGKKKGQGHGHD